MPESTQVEYKERVDFDQRRDRLRLVKEIAAMANSGGGRIEIGVTDSGEELGVEGDVAAKLDPAAVGDLIDDYLAPDRLEITVERRDASDGRLIVVINVPAASEPPVVFAKQGNYEHQGRQRSEFAAHSVVVRRNTKAEPARKADYQQWRRDSEERQRSDFLERLEMLLEAPPGSQIRIVADDEVRDPPSFLLSRSAELFAQRPERLLTAEDLLYLWTHRDTLTVSDEAKELIIQSALRKRASLLLWLGYLRPGADEVGRYLHRAIDMSDRDKSDAGRGILTLAALYLEAGEYESLHQRLAGSRYAHYREAAQEAPRPKDARLWLEASGAVDLDGNPLSDLNDRELLDFADEIILNSTAGVIRSRLPDVGVEWLKRQGILGS